MRPGVSFRPETGNNRVFLMQVIEIIGLAVFPDLFPVSPRPETFRPKVFTLGGLGETSESSEGPIPRREALACTPPAAGRPPDWVAIARGPTPWAICVRRGRAA